MPPPLLANDRWLLWGVAPGLATYGLILGLVGHLRWEHVVIIGISVFLAYHPRGRDTLKLFFPFVLYAIIYDSMRFVSPALHARIPVRVAEPYVAEQMLFGISMAGSSADVITLCEWFKENTHAVIDLACAFGYSFYIFEVFIFAGLMAHQNKPLLRRFAWAFLATNVFAFVTAYLYPAAPPWYVMEYGFAAPAIDTPGNPARLSAVDAMLGITYFQDFYARSANVFASIPSMHVAYPLLVWLYARRLHRWLNPPLMAFWLLVCFSAIYLGHHYVIDVVLGSAYAFATYVLFELVAARPRDDATQTDPPAPWGKQLPA